MFPERKDADQEPVQSLLPVAPEHQQPAAAALPPQGHEEDLQDTVQGVGRARAPGRLLPQPRRLVGPERAQRGSGQLRLLVVGVHQPGDEAVRPLQRRQRRHVGGVERERALGGRGHAQRLRDGVGRGRQQAGEQASRAHGSGRRAGLERRRLELREQG